MNTIAYKFNPNANNTLDDLKNSKIYKIKSKLIENQKLENDEKEFLTEKINTNTFSKSGVPLMGWMFPFKEYTKLFIVKLYDSTHEFRAINKTSLRKYLNSIGYWQIGYIVEIPNK